MAPALRETQESASPVGTVVHTPHTCTAPHTCTHPTRALHSDRCCTEMHSGMQRLTAASALKKGTRERREAAREFV